MYLIFEDKTKLDDCIIRTEKTAELINPGANSSVDIKVGIIQSENLAFFSLYHPWILIENFPL